MMVLEFFVPGAIKGKGNSKSIVRAGDGRTYLIEPKKNRDNAMTLTALFAQHAPPKPIEGPVRVTYQIQYAWRKSDSAKVRAKGVIPKATRFDLGQLEKQIDDCCQAAGLILDDAQITERGAMWRSARLLRHGKFFCDQPGVWIRIEEIES
jgi:Holliday junction resolvase RusA-like endonuclease